MALVKYGGGGNIVMAVLGKMQLSFMLFAQNKARNWRCFVALCRYSGSRTGQLQVLIGGSKKR